MFICLQCWQRCCNFDEFLTDLAHNQCNIKEQQPYSKQAQQVKWLITEYDTEDSDAPSVTLDIKEEISTEEYMIKENSIHTVKAATNYNKKLTEAGHPVKRTKRDLNEIISKWKSSLECCVCKKSFADLSFLKQHYKLEHPNVKPHIVCCKVKLTSRYDIAEHAAFHMDPKAFKCHKCEKCFPGERHRRCHIQRQHCKAKKCTVCKQRFSSADLLREHMSSHTRPNLYKCPACSLTSRYYTSLKTHLRKKHPELWSEEMRKRSFYDLNLGFIENKETTKRSQKDCDDIIGQWKSQLECGICQKSHPNYMDLKHHFSLKHADKKAHILCCQRKLRSRSDIADHAEFHTNSELFKCHECGKCFTGAASLRTHLKFHTDHTYKCLSCGRIYNLLKSLNNHLRAAHPQMWSDRNSIFNFYDSMQIPREAVPNIRKNYRDTNDIEKIISQWRASLECGICQMAHSNFSALKAHFRLEHPKDKAHILCCERKLLTRFKMAEHASWHLDPEAFKCPECGICYKSKYFLSAHISRNHPTEGSNNMYVCSTCDKVCPSPLVLKEHVAATHTQTKLYDCPACTYKCNQRPSLSKHLKSKHVEIWMERNGKKKSTEPMQYKLEPCDRVLQDVVISERSTL